jgi:phosphatidylglycerophosphatase A
MTTPAPPHPDPTEVPPPWHRGPGPTLRHMLLSWFGCGLSPIAPGTVGSLGALPLAAIIQLSFGSMALLLCAIVLFFAGWICADVQLRGGLDGDDPQWIVVDEVVGQWVTLAAVPLHPLSYVMAIALFRIFDITKPWPVSWADRRVPGGLGIMLDDLLAGLYAAVAAFGLHVGLRALGIGPGEADLKF